jgi:large subunit ribosomal protein L35
MPKMKTRKGAAARFKVTGTGRLRREQQNNQHKFERKPSTHTRRLKADQDVAPGQRQTVRRMLGI